MTVHATAQPGRNQACPCGSGKKYKHCCGKAAMPPPSAPTLDQQLHAAAKLLQGGHAHAALPTLRTLHAKHPRHPLAAYLAGYAALECGQPGEAVAGITAALRLGLADAAAHFHLGRAQLACGDFQAAEASFADALTLRPDFPDALLAQTNCQLELGRFTEASAGYRRLLERAPDSPRLLHNLAHAGFQSGELSADEAATMLTRAAAAEPANAAIHAALAAVLEAANRLDAAEASARTACALAPQSAAAATALARVLIRRARPEEALSVTTAATASASMVEQMGLAAARGQALEKLGRHGEAVAAYRAAKALQHTLRSTPFDASGLARELERQRQFFAARQFLATAAPTAGDPVPVFIVGFYRCGSSLLEQMLSMHPGIRACGERDTLADIEAAFGPDYPQSLAAGAADACAARLGAAARRYFDDLPPDPSHPVPVAIIDKQLMNLLRLPLIHTLFPTAHVIHVLRHPLDSAISALSTVFLDSAPWAASLSDTARFYALAWEHLCATRALPGLNYHTVRYEDLVHEPEASLRGLTNAIGLDWDPRMLAFHQSQRRVNTASYAQVTRPLYRDSVERFRPFLPHIESDVLSVIDPVVSGMGYTL